MCIIYPKFNPARMVARLWSLISLDWWHLPSKYNHATCTCIHGYANKHMLTHTQTHTHVSGALHIYCHYVSMFLLCTVADYRDYWKCVPHHSKAPENITRETTEANKFATTETIHWRSMLTSINTCILAITCIFLVEEVKFSRYPRKKWRTIIDY